MKKSLFILIFLPVLAWAQTPGYQGKRFILSYDMDVVPNLTYFYSTFINNSSAPITPQILFNHHLNAEYVLWRRFSIGADISYNQNKPFITGGIVSQTSSTFGIHFIFYPNNDNTLAPAGNYFKIKLFTGSFSAKGNMLLDSSGSGGDVTYYQHAQTTQKINGIGFGFGNNMIVHNQVVLSASFNIDLNLSPAMTLFNPGGSSTNDLLGTAVADHYFETYLIYVKLGIGGLLF